MKRIILIVSSLLLALSMGAQMPITIHSHNDYNRTAPFWEAYSQHAQSIEADVFCVNGRLLVGHDPESLSKDNTFRSMYVEPVAKVFRNKGGRMWEGSEDKFQLMVEIKGNTEPCLGKVVKMLAGYPDVFVNGGVRVVITGNVPSPAEFAKYPSWIWFDGTLATEYTEDQIMRVALFSESFEEYSNWNGKGNIIDSQLSRIKDAVARAHSMDKPIRFWGAPENITPYYTFYNLGIDFFNTDKPAECYAFFKDFANKNFNMGKVSDVREGSTGTKKLDRATRAFKGFRNDRLQLSKGIEVYEPSYLNDGSDKPVKNVIMLIGDGMGIEQVIAGAYANGRRLSVLGMKHTGFAFTNSLNDFTTDSAAGGSALGTGVVHKNRSISALPDGTPVPSLTDWFFSRGKATGSVTMGDVSDATPVVFYGHTNERDSIDKVTRDILAGKVDLIAGSGTEKFTRRGDGIDMMAELKKSGYTVVDKVGDINSQKGKVLCIDDTMGNAAEESNLGFIAELTRESIKKMQERSDNGFFLMVEGPKIDYAGHSKCFPAVVIEQLSFDLAVAEALKFADSNGETLVIVTADHETGGLVIIDGDLSQGRVTGLYTTDDHTPEIVPVFAYGPGAQKFIGAQLNIDVCNRIKELTK